MKEPMPMRMSETNELPPALRDAFGKLGSEAPSAETVLRVQRALEALPAAVPGAAAVGTLGLSKLLVVVTLIAGAATSVVVLKGGREQRLASETSAEGAPASVPLAQPASAVVEPVAPSVAPAFEAPVPTPAVENVQPSVVSEPHERVDLADARVGPAKAGRAKLRAATTAKPSAEISARWAQSLLASKRADSTQRAATEPVATPRADAAPAAQPTPSAEATPAAAPSSQAPAEGASGPSVAAAQANEAQRLAQCKRLAGQNAQEALRQLELLAREVPHGVFVQERELLEIRLHERLGQRAKAAELTQRFLEHHPNSVYRRALTP